MPFKPLCQGQQLPKTQLVRLAERRGLMVARDLLAERLLQFRFRGWNVEFGVSELEFRGDV